MRATKILVTVGPSCDTAAGLRALLDAGANGFRLNFSHGSDADHRATLRRAHAAIDRWPEPVALVADLQGPKIRIGSLVTQHLELRTGTTIRLDTDPAPGDARRLPVTLPELLRVVHRGDPLLLGDGSVALRVEGISGGAVDARVEHGGIISGQAGLFLPRAKLRPAILGKKDRNDLAIALAEGVDYLAISFVQDGHDIRTVRRAVRSLAPRSEVALIAKIERQEALDHIDEILAEADAVMVARGDLGIEVPLERLALEQKEIVRRANAAGKIVIVATQMLLSMVDSARPTRAESTDVANAVLDGADAVMLSEETAVGHFPTEAVGWLARIASANEGAIDRRRFMAAAAPVRPASSVAAAAVRLSEETGAEAIVAPTHSGRTALEVARLRPNCPIWALAPSAAVQHRLALAWGVFAHSAPEPIELMELRALASKLAVQHGVDGPMVLTAGYPLGERTTNLIMLIEGRARSAAVSGPSTSQSKGPGRSHRPKV
ncbi:MAG: pyruvate kinase [Thermoplasmata archaeon]